MTITIENNKTLFHMEAMNHPADVYFYYGGLELIWNCTDKVYITYKGETESFRENKAIDVVKNFNEWVWAIDNKA